MHPYNIVLIADEPWENFTWRRRHHVAWALSKNHKVLFVEPPFSILSSFRDRNIRWRQLFNLGRLKHQGGDLYSYSPFKLLPLSLPFSKRFKFDAINKRIIFHYLKRYAKRLNIKNPILWVFFSDKQYDYYGLLNETITVADLYDKFPAPSWDGMLPEHIQSLQQLQDKIIKEADIIFTVSRLLYDEFKLLHEKVFLVPNGVDYESFENCSTSNCNVSIYEKLKKPTIGFLGMMHYKVDFELLDYIAESHPEWTILLMGKDNIHVDADRKIFNTLKNRKNVIWCGEIDRAAIPSFLGMVDVCLVPLKKLEINRYANYLKIWEYFAAGKPVIAVNQGISYEYPNLIRLANSKEEILRNISEALKEDIGKELVNQRKLIAEGNSWKNRVKQMLKIIEESLATKSTVHNKVL